MRIKKLIIGTALITSLLYPPMIKAQTEETKLKRVYGLTSFVGTGFRSEIPNLNIFPSEGNIKHFLLHPYFGLRWKIFELGLEGNVGAIKYDSQLTTIIGGTLNAYMDLFKIKENKIFIGIGEGFSYWNKSIKEGEVTIVNHKKLPTITHGEIGLKHPFKYHNKNLEFLLSARFSHTSAMLDKNDRGINTWGINYGIRW